MTTDTPIDSGGGNPAPTSSTAPAATPAPTQTPAPTATTAPEPRAPVVDPAASAYKIPDAYKDKPWAAKIKSEDDLYKQIDNLDKLAGKKAVAPDWKTATPEEVEQYYAGLRPADKKEYVFAEGTDPAFADKVSDILMKNGLTAHQANAILPAYAELEKSMVAEMTSAEGFKEIMKQNFGDKYDDIVVQAQAGLKKHLTPEQGKVIDVMPNAYIAPVFALITKYEAEIATMKKEYGINDQGSPHLDNGGGVITPTDVSKVRADLRKQIREIDSKPHTQQEKDDLVSKLDATYRNPNSKK